MAMMMSMAGCNKVNPFLFEWKSNYGMPPFDEIREGQYVLAVKMGLRFPDGFNIKRLVVCVPPSSGKTYCANVYTILMLAHHQMYYRETGIIRMTNNADNAQSYGSQVDKMMIDPKFLKIFPEFEKYRDNKRQSKMFVYESKEKYLLKDCSPECTDSIFMFGVEASINGKRAMLGSVMDDLSGGFNDMDNDELHRKITDKVMSDVLDRSDAHASPDLDIRFKNVGTAKMFFNGSKSLAACFSQSQTVTEGDTSHIMTLSRIFDAVASYILTKGILKRNGRELLPRRVSAHKMRFKTLIGRI